MLSKVKNSGIFCDWEHIAPVSGLSQWLSEKNLHFEAEKTQPQLVTSNKK